MNESQLTPVMALAQAFLRRCFPDTFDRSVSVGLLGSWARGDPSPVSDIDYYIIFDLTEFAPEDVHADRLTDVIRDLEQHILAAGEAHPLGERFSVYWTSLQDLQRGAAELGRFPAYDRLGLLLGGRRLGGFEVPPHTIRRPSRAELVVGSAHFMLDTMCRKLGQSGLFSRLPGLDAAQVARIGPVVLTKAVLMPVRLLYTLLPQAETHPVASTEVALRACEASHGARAWWPLVRAAEHWRKHPPADEPQREQAASLLKRHLQDLYRALLIEYIEATRSHDAAISLELESWLSSLVTA